MRKHSRARQDRTLAARLFLCATYVVLSLATAAALGGCPGGSVLEDPDRFEQYDGGLPAVGGAGMGATAGTAGVGGAGAGTAGAAGTSATYVWNCDVDVTMALKQNCARSGCHTGPSVQLCAGLDLSTVEKVREMVNKPASYTDIGCNVPPDPWRECGPPELPAGCVQGAKLIDPDNFDNSWVVKKMNALTKAELKCGDLMPITPGNSVSNGWDAAGERKQCFIDFFRSLAAPP